MLLRLITVISLILFLLLMISGAKVELALYRSLLAFMILFSVVYMAIFFLNIVKGEVNKDDSNMSVSSDNTTQTQGGS